MGKGHQAKTVPVPYERLAARLALAAFLNAGAGRDPGAVVAERNRPDRELVAQLGNPLRLVCRNISHPGDSTPAVVRGSGKEVLSIGSKADGVEGGHEAFAPMNTHRRGWDSQAPEAKDPLIALGGDRVSAGSEEGDADVLGVAQRLADRHLGGDAPESGGPVLAAGEQHSAVRAEGDTVCLGLVGHWAAERPDFLSRDVPQLYLAPEEGPGGRGDQFALRVPGDPVDCPVVPQGCQRCSRRGIVYCGHSPE